MKKGITFTRGANKVLVGRGLIGSGSEVGLAMGPALAAATAPALGTEAAVGRVLLLCN